MGRFIVIDGLDGSGKETQAKLLCRFFEKKGVACRYISFPCYESDSSVLVRKYLSGEFGSDPSDTNAYAVSTFFAVDRFASYRTDWGKDYLDPDTVVVANRYTTANAIHQLAKLPAEQWDGFLAWLWDYEFNLLGLPRPDDVVFLEMLPEISEKLIKKRSDDTGRQVDIQENAEFLRRSYSAALYASDKLGWMKIKCWENGEPLSRERIHRAVLEGIGYGGQYDN
jgi:dTMP kinase